MIRRHVRNIRRSENRLMRNCNKNIRNIRRRFENVSLGEELYNEITEDLNAFEERVQKRFEEICKNEYHYKRVDGHIAVEDGGETDDGNPMLCFYLFDKKGWNVYMTYGDSRDSLSEVNYSFQSDGFYEDDEYFCGTTEKDLIEAVAEKFARDFDSSEYQSFTRFRGSPCIDARASLSFFVVLFSSSLLVCAIILLNRPIKTLVVVHIRTLSDLVT